MSVSSDFTNGRILRPLITFALPVFAAIFLQTMYGAVDMLVVGQFGTAADVSAVSTGSWIMQLITAVITGLSMGTTILLGQKIGEKNVKEGGLVVGASIAMFAVIGIVLTVVMQFLAPPVTALMQAPAAAYKGTVAYIRICCGGALFIVGFNLLGSIFRGMGNSKLPLFAVAVACVCNIGGDLLCVAVLKMGVAGAALATVASQAISVILSLLIIKKIQLPFTLTKRDIKWDSFRILRVVKLGFPIAFQDFLVSISFIVIAAIVNTLGVKESAGVGIAEKVCGFIMLVPSAFMQSMSAFVAQNIGAAKPARAKKALFYGITLSLSIGICMFFFAFFHGAILTGLFSHDADVVRNGADYLKAYAVDCIFTSFLFCFVGYFNGCGHTTFVMWQGIIGSFGVRIPVSFIMSRLVPVSLFHIGLATPCSTLVQIILCGIYMATIEKKQKNKSVREIEEQVTE